MRASIACVVLLLAGCGSEALPEPVPAPTRAELLLEDLERQRELARERESSFDSVVEKR